MNSLWRLFLLAWVGFAFVGEACQVIHAGAQCLGNAFALFKCVVALAALDFGIIALINTGEHLHLHLCQSLTFSQFF